MTIVNMKDYKRKDRSLLLKSSDVQEFLEYIFEQTNVLKIARKDYIQGHVNLDKVVEEAAYILHTAHSYRDELNQRVDPLERDNMSPLHEILDIGMQLLLQEYTDVVTDL